MQEMGILYEKNKGKKSISHQISCFEWQKHKNLNAINGEDNLLWFCIVICFNEFL